MPEPLVLVTGASGFIAGAVLKELSGTQFRVRGTVRSKSKPGVAEQIASLHAGCELVEVCAVFVNAGT